MEDYKYDVLILLLYFIVIIILIVTFFNIHTQKDDIKEISQINNTIKVPLYKELNDNGLSNTTYIKVNDSFVEVNIS